MGKRPVGSSPTSCNDALLCKGQWYLSMDATDIIVKGLTPLLGGRLDRGSRVLAMQQAVGDQAEGRKRRPIRVSLSRRRQIG